MADDAEKTELPSDHKKQKAREEGNVAKSQEVVGFLSIFAGFSMIFLLLSFSFESLENLFNFIFHFDMNELNIFPLFLGIVFNLFIILLPFFLCFLIAGIMGNVIQFGFIFTMKPISPKFSKLNFIKGLRNVFAFKKLLDGLLITFKVGLSLSVGYLIFYLLLDDMQHIAILTMNDQLIWLKSKAILLSYSLLTLFFFMSAIDFYVRRKQYINSLKMSRQELKDEYKHMYGNPEIKARLKQTMRKIASQKMLSNVSKAAVVITNPTHYAVALKFVPFEDEAPIVVAKGIDHLAIRIKDVARKHNIKIIEQPVLARELYKHVDIDSLIPEMFFEAVINILHQVESVSKAFEEKSDPTKE